MTNAGPLYEAIRNRLGLDDDFAAIRKTIHNLAVKTHDHADDPYLDDVEKRLAALEGTVEGLERRTGSDALASITERFEDHDERFIGLVRRVDELAKPKATPKPKATTKTENRKPPAKPTIKPAAKAKATTGKAGS